MYIKLTTQFTTPIVMFMLVAVEITTECRPARIKAYDTSSVCLHYNDIFTWSIYYGDNNIYYRIFCWLTQIGVIYLMNNFITKACTVIYDF